MKQALLGFVNVKLSKAQCRKRSVNQLYFNNMQLFEYNQKSKKTLAKNGATPKWRLVTFVRKQVEETGNQVYNIQDRTAVVLIVTSALTGRSSRTEKGSSIRLSSKMMCSRLSNLHAARQREMGVHSQRNLRRLALSALFIYFLGRLLQIQSSLLEDSQANENEEGIEGSGLLFSPRP